MSNRRVLHGATVHTQDPGHPRAEALALDGDRVLAVGTEAECRAAAGSGAEEHDLAGGVVVPGFFDGHTHVWKIGKLLTSAVDLRRVSSMDELKDALRDAAVRNPGAPWLEGRGYNEANLREGRRPLRNDLDAAAPGRRVWLTRTCGHIGVASSPALEAAGLGDDAVAPPGGSILRDASGCLTGELHETAMGLVRRHLPEPDAAAYREMVLAAGRHLLRQGITSATDAGVDPLLLQVYRGLAASGELPVRIHAMAARSPLDGAPPPPIPEAEVSPWLRIDTVKLFADGGLSGATAALRGRYRHADERGLLRLDRAGLVELGRDAHDAGLRLAVHAIGDLAIDEALGAFEELQANGEPRGHRIEHCGLPDEEQLARAAALGVAVAPQAIFLAELAPNFRRFLTDDYLARCYPLRSMLDAGLVMALSSDAPVVRDDSPLAGMRAAVLRGAPGQAPLVPEQAITAAEALHGYTVGGAEAAGEGATRGRLAPGMLADLAVLSGDPLAVPAASLTDIHVDQTWVGGEPVYRRRGS
jgi:predicted amidohydrolase YtcJ